MLENILVQRNVTTKTKVTVKTLVSVGIIALATVLPQIFHLALGAQAGVEWLPMYFPVLLGGCLLGTWWGLCVGILSPIVSFLFTSLLGNPMPALSRLPFMIVELGIFALVSGLFSKKIGKNSLMAIPAVIVAALVGRTAFIGLVAIFQSVSSLSVSMVWSQILSGWKGLVLLVVAVPVITIILNKFLNCEAK